jgi:biopolymer transport protein ExbD
MAVSGASQDDAIVGINVTPLVDITLVLLIIFMVTAKIIVSQSIPFDLPKAATAGETQAVFVVDVDAEARVSVDGQGMVGDEALLEAARSALGRTAELRTVVQASAAVSHGAVVHVLDLLRRAGIQKIAFGVEPHSKEAEARP